MMVLVGHSNETSLDCPGKAQFKALLKRKSWIILQESLPAGLVSQVESLYKRQVTSSTNLQMIMEAVRTGEGVSEDTREYLLNELVCLAAGLAHEAKPDHKPRRRLDPLVSK